MREGSKSTKHQVRKETKMKKVITYQSPNGEKIDVCKSCEKKLSGNWPRDSKGSEYCTISHGAHKGTCNVCQK